IGISSHALFYLSESHQVFEEQGLEAYQQYQIAREDEPLQPGDAFVLVNKLLRLNSLLGAPRVEVILLSRNSVDTGLRVFNSIRHYNPTITRAAFCGGDSPHRYLPRFHSHLLLSTDGSHGRHTLELGIAAATILPSPISEREEARLKSAFDGDAVLFADGAERVYKASGL